jgi:predicted transposase YbfD/YdcC
MQPCHQNSRSFFEKLQSTEGLDLRDIRGQRHNLAVVLTGVILAVLSCRDGSLSSIQRHLASHYKKLVEFLEIDGQPAAAVSRAQLPRILEAVSGAVFDGLIFSHFGVSLSPEQKKWFAVDGKQLRGSIPSEAKRGEAVVRAIAHERQSCASQSYYSGDKESEIVTVREMVEEPALKGQKLSLDALHCQVGTLALVVAGRGKYLVGVKNNQKKLLGEVRKVSATQTCLWKESTIEKGHGRIEDRKYEFYDLLETAKNEKWAQCQMRTAVKVTRVRERVKTGRRSREESYYVTNEVGNYEELSRAIRRHWRVETDNYVRDVTLKEDALITKKR